MIPRIIKIIHKEDFKIFCQTNFNTFIMIDFYKYFLKKAKAGNLYEQLLDLNLFKNIQCNGRSLYWNDLVNEIDLNGNTIPGSFELDPVVLYEMGEVINEQDFKVLNSLQA